MVIDIFFAITASRLLRKVIFAGRGSSSLRSGHAAFEGQVLPAEILSALTYTPAERSPGPLSEDIPARARRLYL